MMKCWQKQLRTVQMRAWNHQMTKRTLLFMLVVVWHGVIMLLIMTFALRHALFGVALADLLTVIELHCLLPNQCAKTTKLLHEFFGKLKNPIELHCYCSFCQQYFGEQKPSKCTNAACGLDFNKKGSQVLYFIVIPIINQLQAVIRGKCMQKIHYCIFTVIVSLAVPVDWHKSKCTFQEMCFAALACIWVCIQQPQNQFILFLVSFKGMGDSANEVFLYRKNRSKKSEGNIEDILDGALYKMHFDCGGYFHWTPADDRKLQMHLSFTVNTVGVSIFRSSNFGLWPVYLVINELPPAKRYNYTVD